MFIVFTGVYKLRDFYSPTDLSNTCRSFYIVVDLNKVNFVHGKGGKNTEIAVIKIGRKTSYNKLINI